MGLRCTRSRCVALVLAAVVAIVAVVVGMVLRGRGGAAPPGRLMKEQTGCMWEDDIGEAFDGALDAPYG